MSNSKVPPLLYRGVVIRYDKLKDFTLDGVDMYPHDEPIIDENGKRLIKDGNEYGIYMSDNKEVAKSAYARVEIYDGTPLDDSIKYTYEKKRVVMPAIGVVYKIKTDGLDIRKPYITSYLKGHYNNGFQGDEWIIDYIPKDNYRVYSITIGKDTLHDEESINVDSEDIMKIINEKLNVRKESLDEFNNYLRGLTEKQRFGLTSDSVEILRKIFKTNGLKDIDLSNTILKDGKDLVAYLMASIYHDNESEINLKYLRYLNTISEEKNLSFEKVLGILDRSLYDTVNKKSGFINKKQEEGVSLYSTVGFDKSIEMISDINNLAHDTLVRQAELITGLRVGLINNESQKEFSEGVFEFNSKLEDLYFNGIIDIHQYNTFKKELYDEFNSIEVKNTKEKNKSR